MKILFKKKIILRLFTKSLMYQATIFSIFKQNKYYFIDSFCVAIDQSRHLSLSIVIVELLYVFEVLTIPPNSQIALAVEEKQNHNSNPRSKINSQLT